MSEMNKNLNESSENELLRILRVEIKEIQKREPPNERIIDYKLLS